MVGMQQTLQFTDGSAGRDRGIQRSVTHAEEVIMGWSSHAFAFLQDYISKHRQFMTEDLREASKGIVPVPPSNRAWGAIIVRAVKSGMIRRVGFRPVKNRNAHCTPATLWEVI